MKRSGKPKCRPLKNEELASFFAEFSLLLSSGITQRECFSFLCADAKEHRLRQVYSLLSTLIESGLTLSDACGESELFPPYVLQTLQLGESTGRTDEAVTSLARYYERSVSLRRSLRSALLYPTVMIFMMLAVISVLLISVMPIFRDVFEMLGGELPPVATGFLSVGTWLSSYALWILAAVVCLLLLFFLLRRIPSCAHFFSRIYENGPFTAKFAARLFSARFSSAMSLLLSSGIKLDEAVRISSDLCQSVKGKRQLGLLSEKLEAGQSFADAAAETGVLTPLQARILSAGFRSGEIDAAMERISTLCEEAVTLHTQRLISSVQPAIVAILSVMIGIILLSVMLPLAGVMSSL